MAEKETDPEIKAAFKGAILAILGAPVEEEKRKRRADEREETRFQLGLAGLVLGGVLFGSLWAVGVVTVPTAAAGTIAGGALTFFASLLGVKIPLKLRSKGG